MKFRIVELIHNVDQMSQANGGSSKVEYVIEKKNFWGRWKEIFATELEPCRIAHKTYAAAEVYMLQYYMGHGMCIKVGSEYKYVPYSYSI